MLLHRHIKFLLYRLSGFLRSIFKPKKQNFSNSLKHDVGMYDSIGFQVLLNLWGPHPYLIGFDLFIFVSGMGVLYGLDVIIVSQRWQIIYFIN